MSWQKIKRSKADTLFSEYIRKRAGWKCENCGKLCKYGDEWVAQLDASHYHSRRKKSTRFDPANVNSLCSTCHKRMEGKGNPEYDKFMLNKLGQKELDLLNVRAETTVRHYDIDEKLVCIAIKQLLEKL